MTPTNISVSVRYGSHIPALIQAMLKSAGPVLELGVGVYSTHVLHHLCALQNRQLVTLENNAQWHAWGLQYETDSHRVILVDDWAKAPVEGHWGMALVDHSPDERRGIEIMRLAKCTTFIVAHDANGHYHEQYGYDKAFPKFKYRTTYREARPFTAVLSNFVELKGFWR